MFLGTWQRPHSLCVLFGASSFELTYTVEFIHITRIHWKHESLELLKIYYGL